MSTRVKLFRVEAGADDYDTFSQAIVYATDAEDALRIVKDHIALGWKSEAPGTWLPLHPAARLTVAEIKRERGPVLGYGVPG